MRLALSNMLGPSANIFNDFSRQYFFCGSFLLFAFHVCKAVLSVPYSLMVTCSERADLLPMLCVMLFCFCHFLYNVLGQVWYLIALIPDCYVLFLL